MRKVKRVITKKLFSSLKVFGLTSKFNQEYLHEKYQAKMGPGLSLKIWSNFQAKSQTTLVAKNFFLFKMDLEAFQATSKFFSFYTV